MNNPINGWIILDKGVGLTSAHAVAKVKRLLKPKKIGHAGTLDPLASGVLPLALGEATKTVPYMMDAGKAYRFSVTWGEERNTDDKEGEVTGRSDKRPSKEEILAILPRFIGEIDQVPPAFSAIKVDGERSYALARQGEAVELKSRKIRVDSLTLDGLEGDIATFTCECGKGTYIRSLGRDMGRLLECLGHISALRRLKVGKFLENDAISLEKLGELVHKGALSFVRPVESALDDILALDISSDQAALLKRGQPFKLEKTTSGNTVLARHEGKAIAICSVSHDVMKPVRVFNLN